MIHPSSAQHVAFLSALKEVLARHTHLSGEEMLAVASQFTGMLVAAQDCRRYTADQVMELVAHNIEIGNAAVVNEVFKNGGNA